MTHRLAMILLALAILCELSCSDHDLTRSRNGLVGVAGAVNVPEGTPPEERQNSINYKCASANPSETVTYVVGHLAQASWEPLDANWSDGQGNSYVEGWSCHPDGRTGQMQYVWVGDWINKYGDVVTYAFTATATERPAEVLVAATVVGEWFVKFKRRAHRNVNLSLSSQCLEVLKLRR
jgi:hypothetical protein